MSVMVGGRGGRAWSGGQFIAQQAIDRHNAPIPQITGKWLDTPGFEPIIPASGGDMGAIGAYYDTVNNEATL